MGEETQRSLCDEQPTAALGPEPLPPHSLRYLALWKLSCKVVAVAMLSVGELRRSMLCVLHVCAYVFFLCYMWLHWVQKYPTHSPRPGASLPFTNPKGNVFIFWGLWDNRPDIYKI